MRCSPSRSRRKGSVAPVAALLGTFLIGMIAFGIDIGYIITVQADLQNASDAAALAGADALTDGYVEYSLPAQSEESKNTVLANAMSAARTRAKEYASYNGAGDVNSLQLRDEDISFGYTDQTGDFTPYSWDDNKFPNTVKVKLRRDNASNGAINLFFAPVLGKDKSNLTANASAAIYVGTLDTLKAGSYATGMLPMTYDADHWENFVKTGKDPDGNISYAASNGLPELLVYPSIKYKGNFGQLSLDGYHSGASTTMDWIQWGLTEADIDSLVSLGHLPLSKRDKTQWNWIGNPGMKASTVMAVNDYVGKSFLLPLYIAKNPGTAQSNSNMGNQNQIVYANVNSHLTALSALYAANNNGNGNGGNGSSGGYEAGVGQGANYYYNIDRFVGIKIMPPSKVNKEIVVQPAPMVVADDFLLESSIVPAGGEETTFSTIFTSPRLTR